MRNPNSDSSMYPRLLPIHPKYWNTSKTIAPLKTIRKLLSRSDGNVKTDKDPATVPPVPVGAGETFTTSSGTTYTAPDGRTYSEDQILYLANEIKDYQITHGSLLKSVRYETESSVPARPVGTSIFPTAFPKKHFEEAIELQNVFNELYIRVASDPDWLYSVLEPVMKYDPFVAALWNVYTHTRDADAIQSVVCGVFRSDYMVHQTEETHETQLKQVEINTFFCAGACHAERIANMHERLAKVRSLNSGDFSEFLPQNSNTQSIVKMLKTAHDTYSSGISLNKDRKKCILIPVQPRNFNIADERPIQYELWNDGVACYRCEWPSILSVTTLEQDRTLLFRPPIGKLELEVSVVYYRAGDKVAEYEGPNVEIRLRLEMARAIKCPDVLMHLTTSKCVQGALFSPGAIERFLPLEKCEILRRTFMPMQILDTTAAGLEARKVARDPQQAVDYVLKPNRDGGGHNIYRSEIPTFLSQQDEGEWCKYILMRLIEPPKTTGVLMMPNSLYLGNVVSELGVLGTSLWKLGSLGSGGSDVQVIMNESAGWTFKTKPEVVDEMSVVKGYGCFDCPSLVN